jgi:hypothetical protein
MAWSSMFLTRRGAVIFALLALMGLSLTLYFCAPGYMSADSGDQLEQARSLQLRDDNPVLMALLWRLTDQVIEGPFGMLLMMNGVYWLGLGVFFWGSSGPLLARATAMLVVGLYPTNWTILPAIWKDMLMQAALVACLACLVFPSSRWRTVRYLGALVFVCVALGARHNAAAGIWPLLTFPLLGVRVLLDKPRWLRLLCASAVSILLTLGLTSAVDRTLSPLAKRTEFWQVVPVFDLAGMSLHAGKVLIEPESGVLTSGMGLDVIRRFYQPNYVSRLYYCTPFRGKRCVPVFRQTTDPEQLAALARNWRRAILSHPIAYFKHRRAVIKTMLGIKDAAPGTFYLAGAPHHPLAADYPLTSRATRLFNWIDTLVPSIGFRPWIYVLLGCFLVPVALIRYLRGASVIPVLCLLSGLSYMLGLFITTGSGTYRYTVWTTFAVVLGLATLVIPMFSAQWVTLRVPRARRVNMSQLDELS